MYLEACIQQRRHIFPFVASVDGILDVEAEATMKRIAIRLTKSGDNSTRGHADTSQVVLYSILCVPHTGASGGPGFRHTVSACNAHSGRTALN